MAVISKDTFDPLRRYVRVRLQQGVPIVDADVNEREDIQAFELRAFLKWFVGDGVPEGNDGFHVEGTGAANDFTIKAGFGAEVEVDALERIGRCLVQGLDVMIDKDVDFTKQDLHKDRGAAATDLATKWDVTVVEPLGKPSADATVLVYLDVWERLVTPAEDDDLVHPTLGVESCARMKREWVVRVAEDATLPEPASGHAHAPLATIHRRKDDPLVRRADVVDRRAKRLLLPPAALVEDVLGLAPDDYRTGAGRPPVSLRNAINALLRGELPSTPDTAVNESSALDVIGRAFLLDGAGGLVAIWYSDRVSGVEQVFGARLDLAAAGSQFGEPTALTSGPTAHIDPHAVSLPDGELLVVYQSGIGAGSDVMLKHASDLAGLSGTAETAVATTAGVAKEASPHVVVGGNLATVFFHDSSTNRWRYRRWDHVVKDFVGNAVDLSTTATTRLEFHAALAPDATIWAAFRAGDDIRALQLKPTDGTVTHEKTVDSGTVDEGPFVLCARNGDVWVFLRSQTGIWARRFRNGAWEAVAQVTGTPGDRKPCAVEDAEGGIWLLWTSGPVSEGQIVAMRRHPTQEVWGGARVLVTAPGDDSAPFALVAPDTAIWLFWSTDRDASVNLYYKRLVTIV